MSTDMVGGDATDSRDHKMSLWHKKLNRVRGGTIPGATGFLLEAFLGGTMLGVG